MTERRGWILLGLAACCGAFATYVALWGGINARVFSVALRSRSWERPAALAAVLGLFALIALRRPVIAGARLAFHHLPLLAAAWATAAAVIFGTFAVGGADSYGYVSQAVLLVHGRLTDEVVVQTSFDWPNVEQTLTPLGYVSGRTSGTMAPLYPPGLSLLMAPFAAVDPRGIFLLVPLSAAAVVWCSWRLGRELRLPLAGRLGALLVAVSPTFVHQAVQPMSDVPVTACWMGALVIARASGRWSAPAAGVLSSLAILIRPNLAPLAVVIAVAAATAGARFSWPRCVACAMAMLPGVVLLGVIQYVRYGSPLGSGYGTFEELFALSHVGSNLARYPRWMLETHTPFIALWVFAPFWFVRAPSSVRSFGWIGYAFCVAVVAAYLPYVYFRPEEWFYTRFLLPAIPLMIVLGVATLFELLRRLSPRAAGPIAIVGALGLAVWLPMTSQRLGTFALHRLEHKYPAVGAEVRNRLPGSAFVLAMQHSGSIRYYAGRPILRWDVLDPAFLDHAVAALRAAGREPFVVLDRDEEVAFRERFAPQRPHTLDRLALIGAVGPTRIYQVR
jgi:hypothetical protein